MRALAGDMDAAYGAMHDDDELFEEIVEEDESYEATVKRIVAELDFDLPVHVIDRSQVPRYWFESVVAVVVIGQDGLVANVAKYTGAAPIIGVNPDPRRFDGVLLPFTGRQAADAVHRVLSSRAITTEVTLAEATLQDGQRLLAFNDLFVGASSHVSARYRILTGGKSEFQSSSGVIISTGAGSTGWMSSVINMAGGVQKLLRRDDAIESSISTVDRPSALPWNDKRLMWAVREPFLSRTSGIDLIAGRLEVGEVLSIESQMPEGGVIFSDGVEADFLVFNSGTMAVVRASEQIAKLVVAN